MAVLLIQPSDTMARVMEMVIGDAGHKCDIVKTVDDALGRIGRSTTAIVADLDNNQEKLDRLLQVAKGKKDLPVIVIGEGHGATAKVPRPFESEELLNVMRTSVGEAKAGGLGCTGVLAAAALIAAALVELL